jgi:hypothetical protein
MVTLSLFNILEIGMMLAYSKAKAQEKMAKLKEGFRSKLQQTASARSSSD